VGCWRALFDPEPEELDPEPAELDPVPELAALDDWLAAPPADSVCPWKDLAAASEIAPVATTAPAIIHRLTREISASPASLTVGAPGFTTTMIGHG
jgi:hypothetical protein